MISLPGTGAGQLDRLGKIASDFEFARPARLLAGSSREGLIRLILRRVFAFLGLAIPIFGQYAGPAILSRGDAPAAFLDTTISFRPYFELTGVYDTGLAGVGVNQAGELGNASAAGIQFAGGISGSHSWRHTQVGLDYKGDINHYNQTTYFDSTDQSLLFSLRHQFTRHLYVVFRQSAGIYSQNYGLPGLPQSIAYDPSQTFIPTTNFFDNRTEFFNSQLQAVYQRSARLSFSFSGSGFFTRYRANSLYGVTGASAQGDVQYRISRRSTIGVAYTFQQYAFNHVFSGTDIHGLAGTYSVRISKSLEFSGYGGVMRVETKFIQDIPVDPAIAALIGITESPQVIYSIRYVPNVGLRLSKTLRNSVAFISADRTIIPGNGLFLTSTNTSVGAGYTFTGIRRWSFNANVGRNLSNSIGNVVGHYGDYSGTLSASRQIAHGFHAVAYFSARQYDSPAFAQYNRLIYEGRIGFGWTPGAISLRMW